MNETKDKVTIQDVADVAGVSIATVSRAINNKHNVKASTYQKIMAAVRRVGYNNFVIKNDSKLLLILMPDIVNPFYSEVVKGIASSASRHEYLEIIVRTGDRPLTQSFVEDLVLETNAEGVITLDPISSLEALENLCKKIPVVQCSEYLENSVAPFVSIDDMAASKAVVDYMLSKGKHRIAFINGPLKYKYARKRKEGFLLALEQAGITVSPNLISHLPEFSYDAAVSVATQLLSIDNPPDAIYASSDVFAVAAIKAAKRIGLKIPQDLGVIGFDNTDLSIMCEPPLSSVKQPQFQLGFLACEMLIEKIRDFSITPRQIMLDVELIVRESL
jgi:LacI family transcriptional regulator, repressor for deo operon, udp, cdd, tsx, nupC, and nupG